MHSYRSAASSPPNFNCILAVFILNLIQDSYFSEVFLIFFEPFREIKGYYFKWAPTTSFLLYIYI